MQKSISLLFALSLLFTGCAGMRVTTEPAAEYAFEKVSTYAWVPVAAEVIEQENAVLNRDVQKALNNQLNQHGWKEVTDTEQADIHVSYYLTLEEQQQYSSNRDEARLVSGGFVYNTDSRSWHVQEQDPDLNVYTVEIGTLTVLMHDRATGARIWKGTLKTKIDRTQPPAKQYEFFRIAARKLFARLP